MIGLEKLVELRGPSSRRASPYENILRGVRCLLIIASLEMATPSIFSRQVWRDQPRATCPEEKHPNRYIFDLLANCAVIACERNIAMSRRPQVEKDSQLDHNETIHRAIDLLTKLTAWRTRWDQENRNLYLGVSASCAESGLPQNNGSLIPKILHFESVPVATITTFMLYNAALIHVLKILASFRSPKSDSIDPLATMLDISPAQITMSTLQATTAKSSDYTAAMHSTAMEIRPCVPSHFSKREHLSSEALTIGQLAVKLAWETLGRRTSTEGRWLDGVLRTAGGQIVARGMWTD
ncbi:hypothetical protein AOQ84DRAFT_162979 [Glonium stellatum]|uniref:Uncharacterized protein n=1 Tax=Glonium stellatum TaxID=574774 RepID=A0A8E2JWW9_9PEZI|nr:hypothetical protein AOQ84DRAFT_162979 [Glonium stellatum]